jgi:hypothetical protein
MKQKTSKLTAETEEQLKHSLPDAMQIAILSYQDFADKGQQDGKASDYFKGYHNACRAALTHIELLLKLARLVDALDDDQEDTISMLLQNAYAELGDK